MSTSIESIGQLITQFGVAESGDGLALLRFLSLEVNAAMVNVIGADAAELRHSIERLGERAELKLHERLSPAGQLDLSAVIDVPKDDAYWTPEDWEALRADLSTHGYVLRSASAATHIELVVTEHPGASTHTVQSVLNAAELQRLMSEELKGDWRWSLENGKRVWTMSQKVGNDGVIEHRLIEQQALVRASQTEVQALMNRIDDDTLVVAHETLRIVRMVEVSLRGWVIDFLADERSFQRARHTDERRLASRQEADAAHAEFRLLMERLRTLQQTWPDLGDRLAHEEVNPPQARASTPIEAFIEEPLDARLSRLIEALQRAVKR